MFQHLYILQDCHDILPPEIKSLTQIKGTAAFKLSNTGCSSLSLLLCHQPPAPRCSHAPVILPTTSSTLGFVLNKHPTEWKKERRAKTFLCLAGARRKVSLADVMMRRSQHVFAESACYYNRKTGQHRFYHQAPF